MPFAIIAGAVNAFLAVALGAFGAHILEGRFTAHYMAIWEKAVQYQMFHALGLVALGILMHPALLGPVPQLRWASYLMLAGIALFAGSLYALTISGVGVLGAITPLGGVSFLASWVLLILAVLKWNS